MGNAYVSGSLLETSGRRLAGRCPAHKSEPQYGQVPENPPNNIMDNIFKIPFLLSLQVRTLRRLPPEVLSCRRAKARGEGGHVESHLPICFGENWIPLGSAVGRL